MRLNRRTAVAPLQLHIFCGILQRLPPRKLTKVLKCSIFILDKHLMTINMSLYIICNDSRYFFYKCMCTNYFFCFRSKWSQAKRSSNVYAISDARTRKRIPHESLPDTAEANRNGACALFDGTTD